MAACAALNGVYASSNTPLSGVSKLERIGATDACVFTFENIPGAGGDPTAEGRIPMRGDRPAGC